MDRAYLALVQRRLKEYERAQLDRVTAEAAGIHGAHAGALADGQAALLAALRAWKTALLHARKRDTPWKLPTA